MQNEKLITLLIIGIATIFLISCSKQNTLNGKYYDIYDGKAKLILEFNENGGRFYEIETRAITNVDTKNKSFTFSVNSRDIVVTYDLKAGGNLKYDTGSYFTSSNKNIAYKKDSEAYKKALKITKWGVGLVYTFFH